MNTNAIDNVNRLLEKDEFSRWLGIELMEVKDGYCKIQFELRPEMQNGFGIAHGGVIFSASDTAFAIASNTYGELSVALDVSISFLRPGIIGKKIMIEAKEIHRGKTTALYDITSYNEEDKVVAVFKGTVFNTKKTF